MRLLAFACEVAIAVALVLGLAHRAHSAEGESEADGSEFVRYLKEKVRVANDYWLGSLHKHGNAKLAVSLYESTHVREGVVERRVVIPRAEISYKDATPYEIVALHYLYELEPEEIVAKGLFRGKVPYGGSRNRNEAYLIEDNNSRMPLWSSMRRLEKSAGTSGEVADLPTRDKPAVYSLFLDPDTGRVLEETFASPEMELRYYYLWFRPRMRPEDQILEMPYPAAVVKYSTTFYDYGFGGVEPDVHQSILVFSTHLGYYLVDDIILLAKAGHSVLGLHMLLDLGEYASHLQTSWEVLGESRNRG